MLPPPAHGASPNSSSRRLPPMTMCRRSPSSNAASQLPAFEQRQLAGSVEGTREGSVAVRKGEIGAPPPNRQRRRIDHFPQIGRFLPRSPCAFGNRSVGDPQNGLAGGCPAAVDGVSATVAHRESQRKGHALG